MTCRSGFPATSSGRLTIFWACLIIALIWAGIYLPGLGSVQLEHEEPRRALPALLRVDWQGQAVLPVTNGIARPTSDGSRGPTFLAGAGVKKGFSYGATDEHGRHAVEGHMHTTLRNEADQAGDSLSGAAGFC